MFAAVRSVFATEAFAWVSLKASSAFPAMAAAPPATESISGLE